MFGKSDPEEVTNIARARTFGGKSTRAGFIQFADSSLSTSHAPRPPHSQPILDFDFGLNPQISDPISNALRASP